MLIQIDALRGSDVKSGRVDRRRACGCESAMTRSESLAGEISSDESGQTLARPVSRRWIQRASTAQQIPALVKLSNHEETLLKRWGVNLVAILHQCCTDKGNQTRSSSTKSLSQRDFPELCETLNGNLPKDYQTPHAITRHHMTTRSGRLFVGLDRLSVGHMETLR